MSLVKPIPPKRPETAEELFLSMLTPDQLKQWKRNQEIIVHGSDGRRYRLNTNRVYNVIEVKTEIGFCAYPNSGAVFPVYDIYLAQKLLLETNASAFLKLACRERNQEFWGS